MRKRLSILALALVLVIVQACGSKEKSATIETPSATEDGKSTVVLTPAERQAKLEKDIADWEEKRKIALLELSKLTPSYTDEKGNVVYNMAEVEPAFEGGKKAMTQYLNENIVFPQEAQDNGLEGTVFVDFVVGANGSVREVVVNDETYADVDESFRTEAVRVVSAMPKWVPGKQHGKAVDVKFSLPITFQNQ